MLVIRLNRFLLIPYNFCSQMAFLRLSNIFNAFKLYCYLFYFLDSTPKGKKRKHEDEEDVN